MAEWLRHLHSNPLIVGVVSSNPTGGNFIFAEAFLESVGVNFVQKCQKCCIATVFEINYFKVNYLKFNYFQITVRSSVLNIGHAI